MNTKNLTPKQQRFVEEYLIDLNATQAAIRAGYSRNSARQIGVENLSKPVIAAAVAKAKQERCEATRIDAEWVLREAVALYERCIGEVKPALHPKSRQQMRDADGNLLFTFQAATAARVLELIGKHTDIGAFKDSLEISGGISLVERLQKGRERVRKGRVIDGEFEDVKPVAALPRPRPGATLVEVAPEPAKVKPKPKRIEGNPKFRPSRTVTDSSAATKASEDAEWEERTRGLPAGQWRDPQGLVRDATGQLASVAEREQ